ncbi:hypothetical protein VTL71DRAFT_8310 [Oculimacula yallundae]|uniref:Uncharacterized protein n=1 Tax=Oculimacula yallundae TaxID=86028 RepID=A0ABR4CXE7_9HELO
MQKFVRRSCCPLSLALSCLRIRPSISRRSRSLKTYFTLTYPTDLFTQNLPNKPYNASSPILDHRSRHAASPIPSFLLRRSTPGYLHINYVASIIAIRSLGTIFSSASTTFAARRHFDDYTRSKTPIPFSTSTPSSCLIANLFRCASPPDCANTSHIYNFNTAFEPPLTCTDAVSTIPP